MLHVDVIARMGSGQLGLPLAQRHVESLRSATLSCWLAQVGERSLHLIDFSRQKFCFAQQTLLGT